MWERRVVSSKGHLLGTWTNYKLALRASLCFCFFLLLSLSLFITPKAQFSLASEIWFSTFHLHSCQLLHTWYNNSIPVFLINFANEGVRVDVVILLYVDFHFPFFLNFLLIGSLRAWFTSAVLQLDAKQAEWRTRKQKVRCSHSCFSSSCCCCMWVCFLCFLPVVISCLMKHAWITFCTEHTLFYDSIVSSISSCLKELLVWKYQTYQE